MKSIYVTDSRIAESGTGGGVVSFHELKALRQVSEVQQVLEHLPGLLVEKAYPRNPFMYDYYVASLVKNPIELAQFYGAFFTLTMKVLRSAKKVVTVAAHDLDLSLEEWARFGFFESPPVHLTQPFLFDLCTQGLREETDLIICPSKGSRDFLNRKYGLTNIRVIPHGTDLPDNISWDRQGFTAFNIGQFGPDKGIKYLAEAWQMLPQIKGRLVLAGNPYVEALCKTVFMQDPAALNVICPGYIPEEEKNWLYGQASVYVQPSVTEGFGLPVLEAMSFGIPVVVTTGAGASDLVEDGKDGFVVPIRDPQAIAVSIQYLHDNPSEVRRMGLNARKKAEQYGWEKIEAKYAETIREV